MSDMLLSDMEENEEDKNQNDINPYQLQDDKEIMRDVEIKNAKSSLLACPDINHLDLLLEEEDVPLEDTEMKNLELSMKKTKSHIHSSQGLKIESQDSFNSLTHEESRNMLLQFMKDRETYKEKLRLAKRAIQIRDGHIERMKSSVNIIPLDMTNARIHLAFMYSSPLIRRINGKTENIMQLDYLTEINDIVKVCSQMKYEMKYKTDVATVGSFRSIITDGPIALHFSGHGIENTPDNIGNEYFLNKNKGNILLLEDEQGMSDYFFEEDLKSMIEMSQTIFEVVFVSSCHSQFAGEVFLNAGAKHVICIKADEKISDRASLRFSKVFYETLFVKNYNVCTSYKIAKEEIKKVINAAEANKFMLLMKDEDEMFSKKKHK